MAGLAGPHGDVAALKVPAGKAVTRRSGRGSGKGATRRSHGAEAHFVGSYKIARRGAAGSEPDSDVKPASARSRATSTLSTSSESTTAVPPIDGGASTPISGNSSHKCSTTSPRPDHSRPRAARAGIPRRPQRRDRDQGSAANRDLQHAQRWPADDRDRPYVRELKTMACTGPGAMA